MDQFAALILPYREMQPRISEDAFVAPGAAVIGDVMLGSRASIWFKSVVRGDVNSIEIGARTNIQDGSVVHVTRKAWPTRIGEGVTIGHMALLHGCVIESHAFIGMGAMVMDGCIIEEEAMLAAGAMLTPGKRIPKGELWVGRPAKFMRNLTNEERASFHASAEGYASLGAEYRAAMAK